ncbi:MAG: hypothetical protein AAGE52_07545 [Myxococcota bacterium]
MEVVAECETDRGSLRVFRVAQGLLRSTATGHMALDFAHALVRVGEAEWRAAGGLVHFLDWSAVTGYEAGGRKLCTDWALKRSPELHVLTSHRIVHMGVSTAALALAVTGRKLYSYVERIRFEDALATRSVRTTL